MLCRWWGLLEFFCHPLCFPLSCVETTRHDVAATKSIAHKASKKIALIVFIFRILGLCSTEPCQIGNWLITQSIRHTHCSIFSPRLQCVTNTCLCWYNTPPSLVFFQQDLHFGWLNEYDLNKYSGRIQWPLALPSTPEVWPTLVHSGQEYVFLDKCRPRHPALLFKQKC